MHNGRMPVIGLTPLYDAAMESIWMLPDYPNAILACGGVPLILPLTEGEEANARALSLCDGALLSGGPDPDPKHYGMRREADNLDISALRDAEELAVFRLAYGMRLPMLGVCRGAQLINVALGGTLWQDLPSMRPSAVCHRQKKPYDAPAHTVSLNRDGGLFALLGTDTLRVNSCHHQGIRRLAEGLRTTATAPDGLIEGVELQDYPFLWGVQWHPEMLGVQDAPSRAIFTAFLDACRGREQHEPRTVSR